MPFETPITIRDVIQRIHSREYLLPGIQREFVWDQEQICRLFDSLLRGYPIGSFLFWRVSEEHKSDYKFYEFLRDYHEHDSRHNQKASLLPAGSLTAVLDGQQRLTSLYIGLMGTHATRRKYARRSALGTFAKRRLYLNLARPSTNDETLFDFRFREADDRFLREGDEFWFRVSDILSFERTTDVFDFLLEHGLTQSKHPKTCLAELHRTITELPLINYFTEVEQDLDRVLNIFIRVNAGGTPLSYSDLLLSIASAQWEQRDAREAIHSLVDDINREYGDFSFPRDFVLKSCLMVADVDLRWKVSNFNQANMLRIEELWPSIEQSVRLAVETVSGFGFTGKTLASTNAVIPLVYYLFVRGCPAGFAQSAAFAGDRELIQRWLNIVMLKRTFGGVPDNVLRRIRDIVRQHHDGFPADLIAADLEPTQFSLSFRETELEGLLDGSYGGQYTFPLLAMLYPSLDFRHKFHLDHIHPKSRFTPAQLKKRGIPADVQEELIDRSDLIPNLQLLEGQPNIEKSATPFEEWLPAAFPDSTRRSDYLKRHYIPSGGYRLEDFLQFFSSRRGLLLQALRQLVGIDKSTDADDSQEAAGSDEVAGFNVECMKRVNKHLSIDFKKQTQTCYASDTNQRAVCLVSKRYSRGQNRYWYAFRPHHVEYLQAASTGWVALGCGSPELTVVIPASVFLPALAEMRQTQEEEGRSYWHVECFGDASRLELGQPLLSGRSDVTRFVL